MGSPGYVADFDSATGLLRALGAALQQRPFRRLGRSSAQGLAVRASALAPGGLRRRAFARAGAGEAVAVPALAQVSAEEVTGWAVGHYREGRVSAVAIGSSNGAMTHLCAALEAPWLPQTFLVPVRRDADPDDCTADTAVGRDEAERLLEREPLLQIHQMHDPNQDRLMVARLAYFRMKLRGLTDAYRSFLRTALAPGGTILLLDCGRRWPVTRLGPRHVYQPGAVGGLEPSDYLDGGAAVERFLAEQHSPVRRWTFPQPTGDAPEAEWGYESALTDDVVRFAREEGYAVARLGFPDPEALSLLVADVFAEWFAATGRGDGPLLVETFVCVEPYWALRACAVPLWLVFPTEPSLRTLDRYLADHPAREVVATMFPHGVRSAGWAGPRRWHEIAGRHGRRLALPGVRERHCPADFATLARYSGALHHWRAPGDLPPRLDLAAVEEAVRAGGERYGVEWEAL